ncbi:phage/plasmid primase, P4 family [Virgibacillus sp. AGTR]|uniref:DNA primase family protein n=1 Tax=Virgibacillus sp. AGTR TaxID=2812055 RepID=UPI001D164C7F|nr:phage/plasmid primase, P4 family [Virgibacillus sp. AGTR]MCC2248913.1 phage/plasmid primase, P4 family [Virgibacillus sp. AGTR]
MSTATVTAIKLPSLPKGIYIPDYLADYLISYLSGVTVPDGIDMTFLLDLGIGALKAKIKSVEEFNLTYKSGKKRIPDKLTFDEVAIILMTLFIFKNIQMTDRTDDTLLGIYINEKSSDKYGTYVTNTKYMYEIMERIVPNFKNKDMQDVLDKIERSAPTIEQTKDRHLFVVKNGIYDQRAGKLLDFSPEYVYLTKIPVDYIDNPINPVLTAPDGYQWDVESWIKELAVDDDAATLIWQVIADCLQPHYSRYKSIWFYSEKGNNGKGTIGQLIKNLLGKGNYASLSVADFNHEFLKETLVGSAANISDENDVNVFIDSIKDYKASVTGDDININRKYEKPLRIQFLGTNIQMMNGLPKTKDKSDSFYRRLIIVPFLKSFTNNGERKYIKTDYIHETAVLQYVLFKALNMEFDEYITPQSSAVLLESYKEKNNPVLEFWNELREEFVWDLLPTQFLYDLFVKWFDINNPSGKVMSKRAFSDTLTNVIYTLEDPWEPKTGQNDKVRSDKRMDADEPLITQYGLDKPDRGGNLTSWVDPSYNGSIDQKKRDFPRKKTYRGFLRL